MNHSRNSAISPLPEVPRPVGTFRDKEAPLHRHAAPQSPAPHRGGNICRDRGSLRSSTARKPGGNDAAVHFENRVRSFRLCPAPPANAGQASANLQSSLQQIPDGNDPDPSPRSAGSMHLPALPRAPAPSRMSAHGPGACGLWATAPADRDNLDLIDQNRSQKAESCIGSVATKINFIPPPRSVERALPWPGANSLRQESL